MIISCPECNTRYRIDPAGSKASTAKVKCPGCNHVFEISLENQNTASDTEVSGQPIVLVVDDAKFFREMIKDILSGLAIELLSASDGEEAWQLMMTRKPQLVLLDLNIPGKSGKEILHALQSSPLASEVKVLAMSGVERGDQIAAEVCNIGAADFISKSFKPRELENRVKSILDL